MLQSANILEEDLNYFGQDEEGRRFVWRERRWRYLKVGRRIIYNKPAQLK